MGVLFFNTVYVKEYSFKYLGSVIQEDGRLDTEVNETGELAISVFVL